MTRQAVGELCCSHRNCNLPTFSEAGALRSTANDLLILPDTGRGDADCCVFGNAGRSCNLSLLGAIKSEPRDTIFTCRNVDLALKALNRSSPKVSMTGNDAMVTLATLAPTTLKDSQPDLFESFTKTGQHLIALRSY